MVPHTIAPSRGCPQEHHYLTGERSRLLSRRRHRHARTPSCPWL